VVVVGGGQAGLAIGYFLQRQGRRFAIVEAGAVASAWRERWDSLTLFTPRRYSGLRGLPFPGDPDGYPTRDEVVAYLEQYADRFDLPIEEHAPVQRLSSEDGRFLLEVDGRTVAADQVVVTTGPFQTPFIPEAAERLAPDVFQTHATGYRKPAGVPGGTVLVVGGGNTGFQIAKELSATHMVVLAVGSRQTPLPQRLLGRDLFWWLTKSRLFDTTVESRLGRRLSTRETLIGSSPRELRRRYGVELRSRVVDANGRMIRFEVGSELEVDAVVWATGYRPDYSWIELPVFDEPGRLRHRRGVTDVPGLYFLGLTWQHTRGSALIGWVEDDAEFIAERIAEQPERRHEPAVTGQTERREHARAPRTRHHGHPAAADGDGRPAGSDSTGDRRPERRRRVRARDRSGREADRRRDCADARLQRLDSRPDAQDAAGLDRDRPCDEPGRSGGDRALARASAREPLRRNPRHAGPDSGR
jgi:putative flavoprotein involved in K+ transport